MENETYITRYRLLLLLVRYIQIKTNKYFAVFRDPSKARYRIRGEVVGSTVVSLTYWCNERVAWQCLFCWDVVTFHPKWLLSMVGTKMIYDFHTFTYSILSKLKHTGTYSTTITSDRFRPSKGRQSRAYITKKITYSV